MSAPALVDYVPFAAEVAKGTGMDFYTIEGWAKAEGGPTGNPLNLNPGTDYGSEHAAAVATIANLKTPLYKDVLAHNDPSPPLNYAMYPGGYKGEDVFIAAQAHAIAQSPWNNPKQKGSASAKQYETNIDSGAALAIYTGIESNSHGNVDPANGPTVSVPGAGIASGFLDAIQRAFAWLSNPETWKRIGLGVGGVVLIVGGLFIIVKPPIAV